MAIPSSQGNPAKPRIEPEATVGTVRLNVSDIDRSRNFYEQMLGMTAAERDDGTLELGVAASGPPLLVISSNGGHPGLDRRATGLFHFAVLVPSRRDLAAAIARLVAARWPVTGASDHLVSEALYLDDPDGNGIEIYRDRARSEWQRHEDGSIQMATLPMDIDGVMGELNDSPLDQDHDRLLADGTRMGHVHLQVSELKEIERFYADVLGFDVTARNYPGALFMSAGGYHHHLGLNTWNSRGSNPPQPGAVGLQWYEVRLPDESALREAAGRLDATGVELSEDVPGTRSGSLLARDPSGNGVLLTR